MRCPCRKKSEAITYEDCCGPFHAGAAIPPTAEALMRSRYAAFAMGKADYLQATWHASTRPERIEIDPEQEWIGLKIKDAQTEGNEAYVVFEARSKISGRAEVLSEHSRFVRQDGRWFYVAGDVAPS